MTDHLHRRIVKLCDLAARAFARRAGVHFVGLSRASILFMLGLTAANVAFALSPPVPKPAVTPAAAPSALPSIIADRLQKSGLPMDAMGVAVVRLRDGALVLEHGANHSMQPASTMKTLTSIIALDTLGPAHRGRVEARTSAALRAGATGILEGDLTIVGLGSVDFDLAELDKLIIAIRDAGVREIRGDVVIDRSFFQPARLELGLPPFDASPEFRYNVIPDALLFNMSLANYRIVSDAQSFQIRMTPALPNVSVISNMTFTEDNVACEKWEDTWKIPTTMNAPNGELRIYLEGRFPKNCAQNLNLNLIDRQDFVARMFAARWTTAGGTLTGRIVEKTAPDAKSTERKPRILAVHRGRPLAEVARDINKVSDNTYTRVAYLLTGTTLEGDGTSLEKAERVARTWLRERNINDAGIVIENGSGLSRLERISPLQLARVLEAASKSKWAPEFLSSLPIVGVDGSMRARLRESAAAQSARIKTGSLRNVVSVAGFVPDARGEMHAVVAMINHDRAIDAGGRAILDAMIDWVASGK
jgi:serine-type D-Ala-D-Ala carboxypeptidase/endopeptidase (penicillin-binding protein 4)